MKKIYILLFVLIFSTQNSFSQGLQLSVYSEVSIITIGPGDALFEVFGHNAIRIKDPVLRFDIIYNYGEFDFHQPGFYSNFTKGRLLYWVGKRRFQYFLESYRRQKRWMKEQVLDLTQQEKQAFFLFLERNTLPENAKYLYDPYLDNCSSKLRDITKEILGDKVKFNDPYSGEDYSFRELMNDELPWNTWGSLGINIALGNKLDKPRTHEEYMYLPDYIYLIFSDAQKSEANNTKQLIKKENVLLNFEEKKVSIPWYNPFAIFSLILFLIVYITLKDQKKTKRSNSIDFLLFFVTGSVGILIWFLWFFTNHSMTPNNLNFLWAFAPNIIIAFLMLKKNPPKWIKYYLKFCIGLLMLIPAIWIFEFQLFPLALIPILLALGIRYYYLSKYLLTFEK